MHISYEKQETNTNSVWSTYPQRCSTLLRYIAWSKFNRHRWSVFNRRRHREWLVWLPQWPGEYFNHHFELENVVLHLRTSVRRNEDGDVMLLVDEIQSDWHSSGREGGYYDCSLSEESNLYAVSDAPFIKEWHELGIKIAIWLTVNSGISTVGFVTGDTQCDRWGGHAGLRSLYDNLIPNALEKLRGKFGGFLYWVDVSVRKPGGGISPQDGAGWAVRVPGKKRKKIVNNEVVALSYWQSGVEATEEQVLAMDISPELATIVKTKGVPMFGWWEVSMPKPKSAS